MSGIFCILKTSQTHKLYLTKKIVLSIQKNNYGNKLLKYLDSEESSCPLLRCLRLGIEAHSNGDKWYINHDETYIKVTIIFITCGMY